MNLNASGRTKQGRFVSLDIFRAVAPIMVIYSHIVVMFLEDRGQSSVLGAVDRTVTGPLELKQNFGHLAVVLFFLVSGFIISHVGCHESHREFGIKRLFRIYPLLIFAVLLSAGLGSLGLQVMTLGQRFETDPIHLLTNALLVNYVLVPQVIIVGVAWTLIIEVLFYSMVLLLLSVLRRSAGLAIMIELTMVLLVLLLSRELGDQFFLFAVSFSYLPVVITGQIIWATWSGRIPLWGGLGAGSAAWLLYVIADMRGMGHLDDAYLSTFALGCVTFLAFLLAEPKLRPNRVLSFLADRSYSLYLMHGPIAFPIMALLYGKVPTLAAIGIAVAATFAVSELTYRLIEVTSQRLARRMTRSWRLPSSRTGQSRDRVAVSG